MGISHESVEPRSRFLGAGNSFVGTLFEDLPSAATSIFAHFGELHFTRLLAVGGAYPCVGCHARVEAFGGDERIDLWPCQAAVSAGLFSVTYEEPGASPLSLADSLA